MPIQFSEIVAAKTQVSSKGFSVKAIDLHPLGERASPILVLDDFRVSSQPFGPHPHAGFSAVTYVFEDSPGALRSRDSLGNDVVVGPGGIVWTQAGRGLLHQEVPADVSSELHGLQLFVNASAKNKFVPPKMLRLFSPEVPEWQNDAGDRVRVVVGTFNALSSPLVPAEPFTFLDAILNRGISFDLSPNYNALIYVLAGYVNVASDNQRQIVQADHAIALSGGGGDVELRTDNSCHLVILSGREIREPVVSQGGFIMNDATQMEIVLTRYRRGSMGALNPV